MGELAAVLVGYYFDYNGLGFSSNVEVDADPTTDFETRLRLFLDFVFRRSFESSFLLGLVLNVYDNGDLLVHPVEEVLLLFSLLLLG